MKKIKKIFKNKKGFTLIELIVVIAVLGMIAAIAVPKITGITDKAREEADNSSIKVLQDAVDRYYAENGEYPTDEDDVDEYVREFPTQQNKDNLGDPFYFDSSEKKVVGGAELKDTGDFTFE